MSKIIDRIHPKYYRKGQVVFDELNIKHEILDTYEQAGYYFITLSNMVTGKARFLEFDSHDYGGNGGDPLPKLYRKKKTEESKHV
jgi:hypothetical protein